MNKPPPPPLVQALRSIVRDRFYIALAEPRSAPLLLTLNSASAPHPSAFLNSSAEEAENRNKLT